MCAWKLQIRANKQKQILTLFIPSDLNVTTTSDFHSARKKQTKHTNTKCVWTDAGAVYPESEQQTNTRATSDGRRVSRPSSLPAPSSSAAVKIKAPPTVSLVHLTTKTCTAVEDVKAQKKHHNTHT